MPRERERVVEVAGLEDVDAAEDLLRLDERAVGDRVAADRRRRVRVLERQPGDDPPALLGDPRRQVHVALHDLRREVRRRHALEDHHRVLRHHATLSRANTPATQSPHARSLAAASAPWREQVVRDADGPAPAVAPVEAQERVGAADAEERARRVVDDAVDRLEARGLQADGVAGHDVVGQPERPAQRDEPSLGGRRGPVDAHVDRLAARRSGTRTGPASAGRRSCAAGTRRAGGRSPPRAPRSGACSAGRSTAPSGSST